MPDAFQPFRERVATTLLRNGIIAGAVGSVLAWRFGGISRWPLAVLLTLWPTLGGHFVELAFLNLLRPRLPANRALQIVARLATWFVGGIVLLLAMNLTAMALAGFSYEHWRPWWFGGLGFIAVELVVHLVLLFRGIPNFYKGG